MAAKLNNEIRKLHNKYKMTYIPAPSINESDLITDLDFGNMIDICRMSCQAWELAHTGMNGLRYENFEETMDLLEVYSREICKSNGEDLSSIMKWCDSALISPKTRRAYWFASTMSNCASLTFLLDILLKKLRKQKKTTMAYDTLIFQLDSAVICGYSILKKNGFECNKYVNNRVDESHTQHEGHNHVVLTVKDQLNLEHVIDLSGSQFGSFGHDDTPQIVILPIEEWRSRFSRCRESTPSFPNIDGKLDRIELIGGLVFNFYSKNRFQTAALLPRVDVHHPSQKFKLESKIGKEEKSSSAHVAGILSSS